MVYAKNGNNWDLNIAPEKRKKAGRRAGEELSVVCFWGFTVVSIPQAVQFNKKSFYIRTTGMVVRGANVPTLGLLRSTIPREQSEIRFSIKMLNMTTIFERGIKAVNFLGEGRSVQRWPEIYQYEER